MGEEGNIQYRCQPPKDKSLSKILARRSVRDGVIQVL